MLKIDNLRKIVAPIVYDLQTICNIRPRVMCLITGCPRSGTSAMLSWLKSHKQVAGFYESRILISAHRFLDEVARLKELQANRHTLFKMMRNLVYSYYNRQKYLWRKVVVEKEPLEPVAFPDEQYEEFLENVMLLFPEIKIIFMVREPVAVVWSMMNRKWGESLTKEIPGIYAIEKCVQIWKTNVNLIEKFLSYQNIYVCHFEKLIADPAAESADILKFLSISESKPFKPKLTKKYNFSPNDLEYVLRETKSQREAISALH
jgi:hypothetical protein